MGAWRSQQAGPGSWCRMQNWKYAWVVVWPSVRAPGVCLILFHLLRRPPLGQENGEGCVSQGAAVNWQLLGQRLIYVNVFCWRGLKTRNRREAKKRPCALAIKRRVSVAFIFPYTECPRRNVPEFGRVFLMLKYTDITQNTYVQIWTVTEIMAREVWNFDSCYTLIDYQIHIKTGRNMWFL